MANLGSKRRKSTFPVRSFNGSLRVHPPLLHCSGYFTAAARRASPFEVGKGERKEAKQLFALFTFFIVN